MFYFLMHKNTKVALCKDGITTDVFDEKKIPIGAKKTDNNQYDLTDWENERKIPEDRTNFHKIKETLKKINVEENVLHRYNYGLSLTDTYWFYEIDSSYLVIKMKLKLKSFDKEIPKYEDINYFDKKFTAGLLEKTLHNQEVVLEDIKTPDITTNGKAQKYWVVRQGKFFLVKQNDSIQNYIAEKELLASFIAYLINECRIEGKKKAISTAAYQFEKGKTNDENCCYSEIFTSKDESLVTYKMLTNQSKWIYKHKKLEAFINEHPEIKGLREFMEFIIIFDFITENNRDESDIGFICNNGTNTILRPAPIYGSGNCIEFMKKDFTRANHELYSSNHINVFGMNEEKQCKYIAENIKWFAPEMLYRKSDMFLEYLVNTDMSGLPRQYRDNLADWVKYKIVMIANARRQMAIAEEANADGNNNKKVNSDGEIIDDKDIEDNY